MNCGALMEFQYGTTKAGFWTEVLPKTSCFYYKGSEIAPNQIIVNLAKTI